MCRECWDPKVMKDLRVQEELKVRLETLEHLAKKVFKDPRENLDVMVSLGFLVPPGLQLPSHCSPNKINTPM